MNKSMALDSPDEIVKKIRKAQTDSIAGIAYDKTNRPGVSNLMSILSAVTDKSLDEIETEYKVRHRRLRGIQCSMLLV